MLPDWHRYQPACSDNKGGALIPPPSLIVCNDLLLVVCTTRYSPSEFSAAGESRENDANKAALKYDIRTTKPEGTNK
jgi:hypothetical protein